MVPVVSGELGFGADGGAEGSAAFEFGRRPRIPIGNGGDGPGEIDLLHSLRDVRCVSPVPEEAALFDHRAARLWLFDCGCHKAKNSKETDELIAKWVSRRIFF